MRQGAIAAGATNLKFIYQIVGAETDGTSGSLYLFMKSMHPFLPILIFPHSLLSFSLILLPGTAYAQFDILSLHVYPWNDFPMPETFMPSTKLIKKYKIKFSKKIKTNINLTFFYISFNFTNQNLDEPIWSETHLVH
jgi:hypothetical protein